MQTVITDCCCIYAFPCAINRNSFKRINWSWFENLKKWRAVPINHQMRVSTRICSEKFFNWKMFTIALEIAHQLILNCREIFALMNSYEKLVADIQHEARSFQEENRQLRENLAAIIDENNRLRSQQRDGNSNEDFVGNFRRDYIEMAEKIFRNLREQFVLCTKVM